ncbi:MAG TPA: RNA 2',3'-cyclic phosphodiesterase [Vicinamibacterales bacterium]|nr:RNA 2',3'-cyclic phosphodiesterase [Vicinamibacterales bacterium]
MRLFVAVDVGADVQRTASKVIDDLKRRTGQVAPHARITWVKAEQLHLTVRFIGEVEPTLGEQIRTTLTPSLQTPAFDLTIERTGTFPPKRPPRVIWAGITEGLDNLRSVEQEVRARLDRLVRSAEDRDYHPHLTLGRVKNPAGLRPAVLLDGLESTVFGVVRVAAVTLVESRLSSSGPTYIPLGRAELTQAS